MGGRPGGEQHRGGQLVRDLHKGSSETPLVVFSHMPLFAMYPDLGWGTDDATEALSHMRRFGSVTVLNGHNHQALGIRRAHILRGRRPLAIHDQQLT